jgi:hypothetical protein
MPLNRREEVDIDAGIKTHNIEKPDEQAFAEREHRTVTNWERQWGTDVPVPIERSKKPRDYQSKLERVLNLCDDEKRLDHIKFSAEINRRGHQARGDIDINGFKYTLTDRFVGDLDRALRPQRRHRTDQHDYKIRAGVVMFHREGGRGLLLWARERLLRDDPTLSRPVELVCFGHEKIREVAPQLRVSRRTVERRVNVGLDQLYAWISEVLDNILSAD